ncbi:hypothetical protein D9756_003646 [Leucocoprinus leucothites]|uniref:Zn(2)-C6 fungal-type domain-containing protein n=1 Tax=Leucocoprinus leucothites TaxID=201217 RepID=A0A8H5G6V2_9AGAR|nr:hypothetical protein D9756_003646 [Leucoagaricus leucothites]
MHDAFCQSNHSDVCDTMSSRDSSMASSSSGESSRLPRGSACFNCKRRRVKCDGQRPICGPCTRYKGHELYDCEFYEGQPPQSQVLIERANDLELQIEILEGVRNSNRVDLQSPYAPGYSGGTQSHGGGPLNNDDLKTLPSNKIRPLLTQFGTFASDVGFFLDPDRFMRAATQPHHLGHHSRPCPSLMYAVCLWSTKSIPIAARRTFEETWLNHALRFVTEDLAGSHPRRCLQVMQAEVLLSMYFLNNGKMVEGLVHANAAAALAVSTKSNLIRSASVVQQPSGDTVDEGEWIDGFWTTVTLSNYWVLVNENQTFTFYDAPQMRIDTPWPLTNYRSETLIPASHKTLERFIDGVEDDGYSLLALHTKASVLLKKAIELSNQSSSNHGAAYQYNATHRGLEHLAASLPRLDAQLTPHQRQGIATTHMLTQAAIIKLHRPRGTTSNTARQNCVRAAKAIADLAARCPAANPLQIVNPIIGFVWYIAHDILRTELRYLSERRLPDEMRLSDAINHIFQRMERDGLNSPLIDSFVRNMRGVR